MSKLFSKDEIPKLIYVTIEKIHTGYLLIEPGGRKVHKQTINGVFNYLKTAFDAEELKKDELDYYDPNFPLLICIRAVKPIS